MIQWLTPRAPRRPRALRAVHVDAVVAGLEIGAEAHHHEHRRHPEGDDDGGQDERLRQRVGVGRRPSAEGSAARSTTSRPLAKMKRFTA